MATEILERVATTSAAATPSIGRREVEDDVRRLFAEILKLDAVGSDDDFFDLGGDSLNAVTVMAFIEQRYEVSLPVSAMLEAPTPQLLATLITESGSSAFESCVIRVQESGSGVPLFVIHGIAGDVGYARRISEYLGPTYPVYGMRAVGLRAGETPLERIPDIAARYVSELRQVRPAGPYTLHGYCGGAFIAYEMAQQIRRAGEEVAGLIILDPPLDWRRSPFLVTSGPTLKLLEAVASLRLQWAKLRSLFRERHSDTYRRRRVARTLWHALAHYVPEPYPGRALVIHCGEHEGILLNRKHGVQYLTPNASFVECGDTHVSLFKGNSPTLAETKSFIEHTPRT